MDSKYNIKIDITVNSADEEEAIKEAGYQLYNDSYDKGGTKIKIELLEEDIYER